MRIISKFKDYYDGAVGYDTDTSRVYVRETHMFEFDGIDSSHINFNGYSFNIAVVGFCGKLCPVLIPYSRDSLEDKEFIYNTEQFQKYVDIPGKADSSLRYFGYDYDLKFIQGVLSDDFITVLNSRHRLSPGLNKLSEAFIKYKTPIFFIKLKQKRHSYTYAPSGSSIIDKEASHIIINPCLKDIGFQRVMDTVTTYQCIDMYLHNELCDKDNPDIDPISDKLKAEAHGFNKFSFRKDKQKGS